jgi:hypothetical protein
MDFIDRDNARLQADLAATRRPAPVNDYQSWAHVENARESIERRTSVDSMNVDHDRGSPSPPGYDDDHGGVQGYGGMGGYGDRVEDHVHEIHLPAAKEAGDVEMVEKEHAPLTLPRSGGARVVNPDLHMGGTESQDGGVGGALHVEDAELNR